MVGASLLPRRLHLLSERQHEAVGKRSEQGIAAHRDQPGRDSEQRDHFGSFAIGRECNQRRLANADAARGDRHQKAADPRHEKDRGALETAEGLDLDVLEETYGVDLLIERVDVLAMLESEDYIEPIRNSRVCLTDKGKRICDAVTSQLMLDA